MEPLSTFSERLGLRPVPPPGGFDGRVLHRSVSKERWCITKRDLRSLRKMLGTAIALGLIKPSERDPFDPDDDYVGPNVYTVNDQFIKPVSAEFGNVSWALMLHPEGLQCDLFITHAWVEGMLEFIGKVLNSWPAGAHHAYCCMLSNPQNLDISDLIANPADSPFARALSSAHTMIVVPNCTSSIYSRLWCVYEAFLAVDKGMLIETATTRSRERIVQAVITVIVLALCGILVGRLYCHFDGERPSAEAQMCFLILVAGPFLLSLVLGDNNALLACNCLGTASCSFWSYYGALDAGSTCFGLIFCTYYLLSELDRVRRIGVHRSAQELWAGFAGSVCEAECSSLADRAAIWSEVGDTAEEVDFAINVLLCAGMSTPCLRDASFAGVLVPHAGLQEFAILAMKHPSSLYFLVSLLRFPEWHLKFLGLAVGGLEIAWTVQLIIFQKDRRAFHLKIAHKMFVLGIPLLIFLRVFFNEPFTPLTSPELALWVGLAICVSISLSILVSGLGINRIALLPVVGRPLAQAWVAREFFGKHPGTGACPDVCACILPVADTRASIPVSDEDVKSVEGACSDASSDQESLSPAACPLGAL